MFLPTKDRVLVQRDEQKEQTSSGLYVPSSKDNKANTGIIMAVGEGRRATKTGELIPMIVKVGDRVCFSPYGGQEIEVDGKTHLVLREDEIFAVLGE